MPKLRLTEEQIREALHRVEAGAKIVEVCRELGIAEQTFYRWRNRYNSRATDSNRLRSLQGENHKLKQLILELTLENWELKKNRFPRIRPEEINLQDA